MEGKSKKNKLVFITGATSGIGYSTAVRFAKEGYNVAFCGRNEAKVKNVENELKSYGNDAYGIVLDVCDLDGVKREIQDLLAKFNKLDILVNNAGLALGLEPYHENEYEDIAKVLDTNVKGLAYVTRAVLPHMLAENSGHIINLGSTAGIYAYANGAVYCATKAAIKTLTDGIRIDTLESNIKVTNIQPGIVETPFSEVRFKGDKERAAKVYEGVEALQPEDIADVIYYVANQPLRVQISDVTIMANQQATGFTIARKKV